MQAGKLCEAEVTTVWSYSQDKSHSLPTHKVELTKTPNTTTAVIANSLAPTTIYILEAILAKHEC